MNIKEFVENKLIALKFTEKVEDILSSEKDIINYIIKAILSKKFRKFKATPEYISHIHEVVENSVKNNLPIKFSFPFGAYKLWRLEETPEVDWAELFTLMYYARWLKPIAAVYKPGVIFDFCSDEIIVERLNNIPKSDTEIYAKSFDMLLDFLKKYLPENIKFTVTPIRSLYTPEEFEEDLKDKINKLEEKFGGLPVLGEKEKRMTELNVRLRAGQDADPFWREKTELLHQAYYIVNKRRPYNRAPDKIFVWVTSTKDGRSVSIGTTKTSIAKFWVGVGVLGKKDNSYIEYILSPSQLEKSDFLFEPISIDGLVGKNFSKIRVLN